MQTRPADVPRQTELSIRSKPEPSSSKVTLFAIVRDEMYFLPHFLRHYRALGIGQFWFLDDRSVDGTTDYLMSQPDCGVIHANRTFGEIVNGRPFGTTVKNIVPRQMLMDRWVLTADADEFIVLPPGYDTITQVAQALEDNGLKVARALMMDFFPDTLRSLQGASRDLDPFTLCPNFDPWKVLEWPDGAANVTSISLKDGVRPRILMRLMELGADLGEGMADYRFANVNKSPLVHWHGDVMAPTAHRVSIDPSDRIQLVLAHFKFYPGHEARNRVAVEEGAHWKNAVEYRILHAAEKHLLDWPLKGPRSLRFTSPQDVAQTGLLYSRL